MAVDKQAGAPISILEVHFYVGESSPVITHLQNAIGQQISQGTLLWMLLFNSINIIYIELEQKLVFC